MKVLVMGSGVVGVTTAHRLSGDGHEVTVVDRQPVPSNETSFANAGLIAPGHAYAWSSSRAPGILLRSLARHDLAFRFRLKPDPRLWAWTLLFLRQCTAERARLNTRRKHRLCMYSQQALKQVVGETGVEFDRLEGGLLYLYRTAASFERGAANAKTLVEGGQKLEAVDSDRAAEIDPALQPVKEKIAGAIYCPTDESGDTRKFTTGLASVCRQAGVEFAFDTAIRRIEAEGDRITKLVTDKGDLAADVYVMCLGSYSPILARPLGVRLPIYPVKGYSVTVPIRDAARAPAMGGVDEDNLVAYARFGDRLRLTATADFAGYDTAHAPKDFRSMLRTARDLFPDAADYDRPDYWAGLRPMTPEGTPVFGLGPHTNLFYNTGHGHMGWTMACGAARITADLIAGRRPDIDLDGMTVR